MSLASVQRQIVACTACPRLRAHCTRVAEEKRAAYRGDTYWGKPLPGFGDPDARLLVLGLAPGAHGANRTGRMFTGDSSGAFLMRAMYAAGFATIPVSRGHDDGLTLKDAYILAAVRCAPPGNKPTPAEVAACERHLVAEWNELPRVKLVIALGRLAFDATWRVLAHRGIRRPRPRSVFAHGAEYETLGPAIIASFHPSQQNTFTGKLTPAMLDAVFQRARRVIDTTERQTPGFRAP
jgi:uracil-DNA glycosylase